MTRLILLACACLLAACERPLNLPPSPDAEQPPTIASVTPVRGYAGTRVEITGKNLGRARVRFGTGQPLVPVDPTDGRLVVVVPEDAAATSAEVPLTVTTDQGTATAAQPFAYQGAGRLRTGKLTASVDLSPVLTDALWLPHEQGYFVASGTYRRGTFVGDPTRQDPCEGPGLSRFVENASYPTELAGGVFAVLEERTPSVLELRLCGERTERVELGSFADDDYLLRGMAADAKGETLLVAKPDYSGVFAVDVRSSPAEVVSIAPPTPDDALLGFAPAADGGFIVGTTHGLRRLRRGDDGWAFGTPDEDGAPLLRVLDAVSDYVLATDDAYLFVYALDTWPPTLRSTIAHYYDSGALSEDCRRVAAHDVAGNIAAWDVTQADAVVAGGVPLEGTGRITRGRNGTFSVPGKAGVHTLAAPTGSIVETAKVDPSATAPVLRTTELRRADGTTTSGPTVELAVKQFGVLVRMDAATMTLRDAAIIPLPDGTTDLTHLVTGGADVLVAVQVPFSGLTGDVSFVSPAAAGSPLRIAEEAGGSNTSFYADEAGLGWPLLLQQEVERETSLTLLDPARAAAGQPFVQVVVAGRVHHAAWLDDDTVAVSSTEELQLLDGAALRAGSVVVRATYALDAQVRSITRGPEGLVATDTDGRMLWLSGDGQVRAVPIPGATSVDHRPARVLPGGRRVVHVANGLLRFWSIEAGALSPDDLLLVVERGLDFAASRDGQRLLGVEVGTNRLLAFE